MPCKICGKPFKKVSDQNMVRLMGVTVPTCNCGKVRLRERLEGCAKCGAQDKRIQMKKTWYGYYLYCTCGHSWRVRK